MENVIGVGMKNDIREPSSNFERGSLRNNPLKNIKNLFIFIIPFMEL